MSESGQFYGKQPMWSNSDAKSWRKSPEIGARKSHVQVASKGIWWISAIFCTWHGGCNFPGMAAGWSLGRSRRYEMTLSINSLQSLAISLVGALVASSLFLSAAVGPVPVI